MLSSNYRIKLEEICRRIEKGENVELSDMIWAEKLGQRNHVASRMLRQARRKANTPTMQEGDMDDFLNQLDIGSPDPRDHKTGFDSVDEIVDWFRRDEEDDSWRRRD
jgi:hypothetical protein